jgi:hypothetical protein
MHTHDELEQELRWLDARMPGLMRDMDAFFGAFESESVRLIGGAQGGDHAWLEDELLHMVQRHGITPGTPAP